MTGTITDLRFGRFGFVASDVYGGSWKPPFRRAAVAGDGFDDRGTRHLEARLAAPRDAPPPEGSLA